MTPPPLKSLTAAFLAGGALLMTGVTAWSLWMMMFPMPLPERAVVMAAPLLLIACMTVLLLKILLRVNSEQEQTMRRQTDNDKLALLELATHQLGAPLATFRWWLEILKSPEANKMDAAEVTREVETAVTRMDQILKSLTHAREVDLKSLSMQLGTIISLRHLALDAVHDFANDLQMKDLKIALDIPEQIPAIQVDSAKIGAILRELISNAISYSPAGTEIGLKVTVDKKKTQITVEVSDHGMGIPAADKPRIGEKFFRAPNAVKAKPVGNGLGLFTVKGIVEELGGRLKIQSTEGTGTIVSFTLPCVGGKAV